MRRIRKLGMCFILCLVLIVGTVPIFANTNPITWDGEGSDLSADKLTYTTSGDFTISYVATEGKFEGKWYWEVTLVKSNTILIGINDGGLIYNMYRYIYFPSNSQISSYDGKRLPVETRAVEGDTIGIALDIEEKTLAFYVNGKRLNTIHTNINISDNGVYPCIGNSSSSLAINGNTASLGTLKATVNFGATEFKYPIPEGYKPYDETSVVRTPSSLAVLLEINEKVQLSVTDDIADNEKLDWTSSDEVVASVDNLGKVTAHKEGTTYITAKNEDGSYEEQILVRVIHTDGPSDELRLSVHINSGESRRLYLNDDFENITWKSMDESIVKVDNKGKITGVSSGLALITAEYKDEIHVCYVRVA